MLPPDNIHRPWWRDFAPSVGRNGFSPVVVLPSTKQPRFGKWATACYAPPNTEWIIGHGRKHGRDSIGLACGRVRDDDEIIGWLFAVDCDADDSALSTELDRITIACLGETPLVRFGRPNRWVRLYRSPTPVRSAKTPCQLEILGVGRQVLGFGIHPDTAEPYSWLPDGSPVEVKASDLPLVPPEMLLAFLQGMGCEADAPHNRPKCGRRLGNEVVISRDGSGGLKWTTDANGLVVDGRDAFLAWCVARASGDPASAFDLFAQHADLNRPKRDGRDPWTRRDAEVKAKTFERKQRRGALPNRKAKGRPANGDWSGTPWSVSDVEAFNEHVRQLCLKGELSRAEMKVSVAMASFLPERGQCFAAVERIAQKAEVSVSAVKRARPALERLGLWRSAGSTGKTTVYVPLFNRAQVSEPAKEKVQAVHTSTPYNTSKGPKVLRRGLDGVAASNDNREHAQAMRAHQLDLFQDQERDNPLTFARWVREQRQRMRLSQRALARKIGCRQPHLANVKRGHDRLGEWPSRRLRELLKEVA